MKPVLRASALIASLLLVAACSEPVKLDQPKVDDHSSNMDKGAQDPNAVAHVQALDPLMDPNNPLAKRSIYFDYDSFVVKDDYRGTVQAHANYLLSHKDHKIIIQGNTDERGGSEYNLALGQKRAEAVRKSMSLLGVSDAQMEAVSLGKEKPRALGHDDAAWAENRRADIVY